MRILKSKPVLILAGACCLLLIGIGWGWYHRAGNKLNVILVTLDTTRADRMGCYGYREGQTPAFDALAQSGVLFENAYAPVPITFPSHTTMLTGRYPPEHGIHLNSFGRLSENVPVLAESLLAAKYDTGAFLASFALDSKFGLDRGFQTYDDDLTGSTPTFDSMHRYRPGDLVMNSALSWLKDRKSRSFFCWIHLFDAHAPYLPREDSFGNTFVERPYDAGVAFADLQLQRLREFLQSNKLDERTIIIVVGDHGEGLMDHQEREHGFLLYNTTVRVPMVIAGAPLSKPGYRVTTPVSLVDLLPTIFDCLEVPQSFYSSGRSLKPALAGESIDEKPIYLETDWPLQVSRWAPQRAAIKGNWKYTKTSSTQAELYDLSTDPNEEHDLAKSQPERLQELSIALWRLQGAMDLQSADSVNLTEGEVELLKSLGYIGSGDPEASDDSIEQLPNMREMTPVYNQIEDALHLLHEHKTQESLGILRKVLEQAPDCFLARNVMGVALIELKQYAEAAQVLQSLIQDQPDNAEAHSRLGRALGAQGLWQEGLSHFQKAVEIQPHFAAHHFALGMALKRLGKSSEAASEFEAAVQSDPGQVLAQLHLADYLAKQPGRIEDAIQHYQLAIKYHPGFAVAHSNLGAVLFQLRRNSEAEEHFTFAIELEPQQFEPRLLLAQVLLSERRFDDAIAQLTMALQIRPNEPNAISLLQQARMAQTGRR